jgi:hypothetical protein
MSKIIIYTNMKSITTLTSGTSTCRMYKRVGNELRIIKIHHRDFKDWIASSLS